jgi:hypothetical protein
MAQMQMVIASIYDKYNTVISPKTTDASMEVVDQITSAGPKVLQRKSFLIVESPLLYRVCRAQVGSTIFMYMNKIPMPIHTFHRVLPRDSNVSSQPIPIPEKPYNKLFRHDLHVFLQYNQCSEWWTMLCRVQRRWEKAWSVGRPTMARCPDHDTIKFGYLQLL